MKHYLIYKITNNLNGKIYIGKHVTEDLDDGYMGSGVVIKRAIKRHGIENFTKEILFDVYGEDLMNFLEEAIVDEAFVARNDTYNIAVGGKGGFSPVCSEETRRKMSESQRKRHPSEETKRKISDGVKKSMTKERRWINAEYARTHRNVGWHHSEETRRKLSEANKGKHQTEEQKKRHSEFMKGRTPWNKGKTGIYSEETRKKMSESHKRKQEEVA